jgi:exonuclease SbcC
MSSNTLALKLTNYRRFEETDIIAFQPGLTIINGPNGAGKSTLIEAFLYALYGPKGTSINDIRTDGLIHSTVQVACQLCIDNQEIHIIRSDNEAELRINNSVEIQFGPSSGKAVTNRVRTLLGGLSREQFEQTYVALQGDTAGLVNGKASERRHTIEKILQLEVLSKAIEQQNKCRDSAKTTVVVHATTLSDNLALNEEDRKHVKNFQSARTLQSQRHHVQRFEKSITQVRGYEQGRYQKAEADVLEQQSNITILESHLQDIQKALAQATDTCKQLGILQKEYEAYNTQIASVEGKLVQTQKDIQRYQATIQRIMDYAAAAAEYKQLEDSRKHYQQRLERIPLIEACYKSYEQARAKVAELDHQLAELASIDSVFTQASTKATQMRQRWEHLRANDPTRSEVEAWQRQSGQLDHEEEQNRQALKLLRDETGDSRCPTCNQQLTEHSLLERIEHLRTWFDRTLPDLRNQLAYQEQTINEKKQRWEQECQQAENLWKKCDEEVHTIKTNLTKRDWLLKQRTDAQAQLQESQQKWIHLEANPPDPQEKRQLQWKLEEIRQRMEELKEQANSYERLPQLQEEVASKQDEHKKLLQDKQALLEQQCAVGYQPEAHQAAREHLDHVTQEASQKREQYQQAKFALQQAQMNLESAGEKIERIQRDFNRFETCVQEYYREETLRGHLEEFKKHFFAANTEEVIQRTTRLLMHAITDQSILGVQFDKDEFQYIDASRIPRPISRLSGGEKSLVGLCLRIALAEQAQAITRTGRVSFLILDEVLSSLDEERCEAVQRIFEDVQNRGIFEHIIMITHLDTVKQNWRANGLVVQKLNGKMSQIISISPDEIPLNLIEEIEV